MTTDQRTAEVIRYAQEIANNDRTARAVLAMRGDMLRLGIAPLVDFLDGCCDDEAVLMCVVRPGE